MPPSLSATKPGRVSACIWITALASLLPFIVYHRCFSDLFWFGDEWDLLDQMSREGFVPWASRVFAENFVPLFKVLWGGLALAGGGSYLLMLTILWLTHALAVGWLGKVLEQSGFGLAAVLPAITLFGLASCNIETLAWSVQWSSVLSCLFFLLAAAWFDRRCGPGGPVRTGALAVLILLCAASALSFSRGVVTGIALAMLCFVDRPADLKRTWRGRTITALGCLAPSLTVALVIALAAGGNHQHLLQDHQLPAAIRFGAACFGLNPFLGLMGFAHLTPVAVALAVALKLALIVHGFIQARDKTFRLLLLFLLFDLGGCALLGVGRYHTGLQASISSRYQYASLICSLPFLGIAVERLLALCRGPSRRLFVAGLALFALTLTASFHWGREIRSYSGWRGREARQTLFIDPRPPAEHAVPGIPFMSTDRAKQLIAEYDLH